MSFFSGMETSIFAFGWNKYTSNIVGFGITQKTDVLGVMKSKVLKLVFSDSLSMSLVFASSSCSGKQHASYLFFSSSLTIVRFARWLFFIK